MGCGDSQDRRVQEELDAARRAQSKDHKLLLLGAGSSGKSTFFKQLCQIHGNGFQKQDIEQAKQNIYDCVIDQMKQLLDQCIDNLKLQEQNGIDSVGYDYTLAPSTQQTADYMLSPKVPRGGIEISTEIANLIEKLWADSTIKYCFETRQNLGVVDSAPHFFNDIRRISQNNYVPTDQDILLVRIPTTGLRSASFHVDKNKFTIVDVGGQRSERSKWIHQFAVVDAVLFVASLSCYDQNLFEEEGINAMHESIKLFEIVIKNRYFRNTSLILFLNKCDLFEEKIKIKSIKPCFSDFQGADGDKEAAIKYITDTFVSCNEDLGRQVYSHVTCATDSENVSKVFHDVQHAVVTAALHRNGIM